MSFDPKQLRASEKERRRGTAKEMGYTATAGTAGTAGLGVTMARWTPEKAVPHVERHINAAAREGSKAGRYIPPKSGVVAGTTKKLLRRADKVQAGTRFKQLSQWSKANPKKAMGAALGLKGAALTAGVAARYRRDENQGMSMDIGNMKAQRRKQMRNSQFRRA